MAQEKLTREQLYEQVWSKPMSKLALEYGISDVALAKTCRRLGIPKPGRGYWACLAAGQKLRRPPLPKLPSGKETSVYLERAPRPAVDKTEPSELPPKVDVSDTLRDAHKIVQKLARALQDAPFDETHRIFIAGPKTPVLTVSLAVHRRALLILDALCKALAARGHEIRLEETANEASLQWQLLIGIAGELVEVSLNERLERHDHVPTKEEQDEANSPWGARVRKYDYLPGGRLQFNVRSSAYAETSWSDTKRRPLEPLLGSIVLGIEATARARRERREIEDQRQRSEQEARHRQEIERARSAHEALLVKDLKEMATNWHLASQLRGFLQAVDEATPPSARGESFTAWLRWAAAFVDSVDPTMRYRSIPKSLDPSVSA